MATTTNQQYDEIIANCRNTFIKKTSDYGTSWRVYRTISVADQIYIKAKRIRTIQEKKMQRIGDDIKSEFEGILNYSIIGLIQLQINDEDNEQLPVTEVEKYYDAIVATAKKLMEDKNHDYGEAWREMSQESFTDLTLAKILRIKQIISNSGKTIASEGIDANFYDILNYALFALILIKEGKQ
jgi:CRISPR/Cas system CSM-associated protein Csm2 small subunit